MDEKIENILNEHESRLRALERLLTREPNALKIDLTEQEIMQLSPRTQAERITAGIDKPRFIGRMSKEVLEQMIWSMENLKEAFRKPDHELKLVEYKKELATR